jgi:hypothetical protein
VFATVWTNCLRFENYGKFLDKKQVLATLNDGNVKLSAVQQYGFIDLLQQVSSGPSTSKKQK